jgi:L-ascorbate metabolism protein UlaG (beta-lactamase superfamily)
MKHRHPPSDHCDGERFHNGDGLAGGKSLGAVLRWMRERRRGSWTRDLTPPSQPPPPRHVGEGALRATFVNQATVLLQADGLNILTDPLWSERASPVQWAGPQRWRAPGIRFEDLPAIDLVVVSHNHYDHMDADTLRRLARTHRPRVVTALGNGAALAGFGLQDVVELDWQQSWTLPNGRRLWAEPAQHWSGRTPADRNRALWMSCVIETAGGPLFFAGDSGYGAHFGAIRERHGRMRLALLPIGAYLPRWFMRYQHMDPAEAVQAHRDLGSAFSLGIHYGCFELSDEGQEEPVRDLLQALAEQGLDPRVFAAAMHGAGYDVPGLSAEGVDEQEMAGRGVVVAFGRRRGAGR